MTYEEACQQRDIIDQINDIADKIERVLAIRAAINTVLAIWSAITGVPFPVPFPQNDDDDAVDAWWQNFFGQWNSEERCS